MVLLIFYAVCYSTDWCPIVAYLGSVGYTSKPSIKMYLECVRSHVSYILQPVWQWVEYSQARENGMLGSPGCGVYLFFKIRLNEKYWSYCNFEKTGWRRIIWSFPLCPLFFMSTNCRGRRTQQSDESVWIFFKKKVNMSSQCLAIF